MDQVISEEAQKLLWLVSHAEAKSRQKIADACDIPVGRYFRISRGITAPTPEEWRRICGFLGQPGMLLFLYSNGAGPKRSS